MIYFAQAGEDGPVKIGCAKNVASRLRILQAGNHLPLRVIRNVDGGRSEEAWAHNHFRHLRIEREWFRFHPDMLSVSLGNLPIYKQSFPYRYPVSTRMPEVIAKFGGIERMAELLGDKDRYEGRIREWMGPYHLTGQHVRYIVKIARRYGIPVSHEDFMRDQP